MCFYHWACRIALWDCLFCKTHVVLELFQRRLPTFCLFSNMLVMSWNAAYVDISLGFETEPNSLSLSNKHTLKCSNTTQIASLLCRPIKHVALHCFTNQNHHHNCDDHHKLLSWNSAPCLSKTTLSQSIKDFLAVKRAVKSGNKIVNVNISSVASR